ncbi:MAG: ABC transporter permease [Lachnospiraceae bacterium]|nr:ABC transporter permease [Lachnospiraceae bacterium]
MKNYILSSRLVMGSLCAILLFMGLMNYVNVTATGLVIRKKEFAVMESIGMTEKQLKKMLLLEGMFYSLIISVLTAVLGTGLLWLSGKFIKEGMEYFVFNYPIAEYAVCVLVLFVSCILIVYLMYHWYGKGSIYFRMRRYSD